MLTVYMKEEPPNTLWSAGGYFDFAYYSEWFEDQLVKDMVLDVDKTEVITALQCVSPVFGPMACTELSGGVKGLLLVYKDQEQRNFRSTIWGANCVKWIAALSFKTDFGIWLTHPLEFISGAEKGALPICAKGEDGQPLNTCAEVWNYYANHC